jgi:hypothetical protein
LPRKPKAVFTLVCPVQWPFAALRVNSKIDKQVLHRLVNNLLEDAEEHNIVDRYTEVVDEEGTFVVFDFSEGTRNDEVLQMAAFALIQRIVEGSRSLVKL